MEIYTVAKMLSIGASCFVFLLKLLEIKPTKRKQCAVGAVLVLVYFILNMVLSNQLSEPYKGVIVVFALSLLSWKCFKLTFDDALLFIIVLEIDLADNLADTRKWQTSCLPLSRISCG